MATSKSKKEKSGEVTAESHGGGSGGFRPFDFFCSGNPDRPTPASPATGGSGPSSYWIQVVAPVSDQEDNRTDCAIIRNAGLDEVVVQNYEGSDLDPFDGTVLRDSGLSAGTYRYRSRAICNENLVESGDTEITVPPAKTGPRGPKRSSPGTASSTRKAPSAKKATSTRKSAK